jgi:hypothetical protein
MHDVLFKLCDEIARLHDMGERVTPLSEEEASRFAEKLCDDRPGLLQRTTRDSGRHQLVSVIGEW